MRPAVSTVGRIRAGRALSSWRMPEADNGGRVALPAVPMPPSPPSGGPEVLVTLLDPGLPVPSYAHPGDAGADLVTAVDVRLAPGERAVVPTGVAIALPPGFVAFVHPRSGLAARCGLTLVNSPGTIDAGYRGEIKLIVINHDPADQVRLTRGDRIAQLVIQRVEHAVFRSVSELPDSARGTAGHGSTGGHALLAGGTA